MTKRIWIASNAALPGWAYLTAAYSVAGAELRLAREIGFDTMEGLANAAPELAAGFIWRTEPR